MTGPNADREAGIKAFETEAEVLVVHQLDLLAQLEAQLRAVHRTMRCIEKLRGGQDRVGPELTNGGRSETLTTLASALAAIDQELHVQHQSCEDMQRSIREMQARLSAFRLTTEQPDESPHPEKPYHGNRPGVEAKVWLKSSTGQLQLVISRFHSSALTAVLGCRRNAGTFHTGRPAGLPEL